MLALPADEVDKKNIAYLTDRVRVANGKLQVYGTQHEDRGGYSVTRPVEDLEHLDEIRATVGLPPMSEYFKMFDEPVYLTGADYMKAQRTSDS